MKKGLKIAVLLGTIGVLGTVGYLVYKKLRPNLDEGQNESNESNESNPKPKPKPKSKPKLVLGIYKSTPFKNKEQGNLFRKWVNETYPKYAKDIDLSTTGQYNNAYIQTAYAKYGAIYKPSIKDVSNAWKFNLPFNIM